MLDYFNGFHDGFIKRFAIASKDEIDKDFGHTCMETFDVTIDFAHFNYNFKQTTSFDETSMAPYNQVIRAAFHNVQDLFCDFSSGFRGNTISSLRIHPMNRRRAGSTATESCLALYVARHYYLDAHQRSELRESQVFTFSDAVFREQPHQSGA